MSTHIKDAYQFHVDDDIAKSKAAIFDLIEHNELLDEDGYPTDAALDIIQLWHWSDVEGWFKFIDSVWSHGYGTWKAVDEPLYQRTEYDSEYVPRMVRRYHAATGGWSGNESIICAMQDNKSMLWTLTWVQSRRGGHHTFELKEFK